MLPSQLPFSSPAPLFKPCAPSPAALCPTRGERLPLAPPGCHPGERDEGGAPWGLHTQDHQSWAPNKSNNNNNNRPPNVYSLNSFGIWEGRKSWLAGLPAFQESNVSLEKLRAESSVLKTTQPPLIRRLLHSPKQFQILLSLDPQECSKRTEAPWGGGPTGFHSRKGRSQDSDPGLPHPGAMAAHTGVPALSLAFLPLQGLSPHAGPSS